jgi:lipid II:glycine glycyltransferase (peptidoglycan interpeptide bridge formation enzyme)
MIDAAAWDGFVRAAPNGHVLQTTAWARLKGHFGWEAGYALVEEANRIQAGAQVLFRPLPLGLGCVAYVPKGPLVNWTDDALTGALLDALHHLCRRQRAIFLKIEPDEEDRPALAQRLQAWGFRPSPQTIQPRRTILIDLTPAPDNILAQMKSKTRYNIRLAERKGVTVRAGTEHDLDAFYRLMLITAERDRFGVHSRAYYETVYQLFVPRGIGRLLLAEYEGELIAGVMVFAWGDKAWYMYGASSDAHRERMPNYLLQWQAMLWAKSHGCRTYDLWGIPDEDEETLEAHFLDRHDGLWGVYRFKRGFGGRVLRYVGAWDQVYRPALYWLYCRALR